jgi:hypothetical protein
MPEIRQTPPSRWAHPVTVGADEVWDGDEVIETWTTPSGVELARIRPTEAHAAQIRADFVEQFGEPVTLVPVRTGCRQHENGTWIHNGGGPHTCPVYLRGAKANRRRTR